jgi:hypothetical protein
MSTPSPRSSNVLSIGTPEQYRWLRGIVANPVLRDLIDASPVAFVGIKLGLVGLGSSLLWRHRDRPLAVIAIFLAFLVYYALLLWHLGFLALVVGELLVP